MERNYRWFGKFIHKVIILSVIAVISVLFSITKTTQIVSAHGKSSYAIIRTDNNEIIEEVNGDIKLPMASTTKIMTALIAIENCNLNEIVNIDKRAVGITGSSVYLKEGESLTLKELLYCLMLRSGNDSAVAIALHVCPEINDFAEMMNIRAKSLGLINTNFVNPHGLHDNNHYTTAKELAIITSKAMNYNVFREIVKTKKITIGENDNKRILINKNKMLNIYENGNGVKTGYTKKAGRCLVSSATKKGITLVSVVLNYGDTYGLSSALLDKGFSKIGI